MKLIKENDRRIVQGYGSVEVLDRQNELIPIDEIRKFMRTYIKRGAPLMYNHTNQSVGKLIDYEIVEKNNKPAILIKAEVYDDYPEDDDIWDKVNSNIITGFSIGGGRPERKVTKEGAVLYNTPVWEFSLVERPANQMSTITAHSVAKSDNSETLFVPLSKACDEQIKPEVKDKKINEVETMVVKEEAPKEETPTLESRVDVLEKALVKIQKADEEVKEAPKEEDKKEEVAKEEAPKKEPAAEEDKKEDIKDMQKAMISAIAEGFANLKKSDKKVEEPKVEKNIKKKVELPVKKSASNDFNDFLVKVGARGE